jgi:hypothetical protein
LLLELQDTQLIGPFIDAECPENYLEFGCKVLNALSGGAFGDSLLAMREAWEMYNEIDCEVEANREIQIDPALLIASKHKKPTSNKAKEQRSKVSLDMVIRKLLDIDPSKTGIHYRKIPIIDWQIWPQDGPCSDIAIDRYQLNLKFKLYCRVDGSLIFKEVQEEYMNPNTIKLHELNAKVFMLKNSTLQKIHTKRKMTIEDIQRKVEFDPHPNQEALAMIEGLRKTIEKENKEKAKQRKVKDIAFKHHDKAELYNDAVATKLRKNGNNRMAVDGEENNDVIQDVVNENAAVHVKNDILVYRNKALEKELNETKRLLEKLNLQNNDLKKRGIKHERGSTNLDNSSRNKMFSSSFEHEE